jgi:hypothetical protein
MSREKTKAAGFFPSIGFGQSQSNLIKPYIAWIFFYRFSGGPIQVNQG